MNHPRPHASRTRAVVLVIDERDDARALYALALTAMGFDVAVARDGAEAYTRAAGVHPDIVVTDLPARDGDRWQLLRDLHRDPDTRDTPVIAIGHNGHDSMRDRADRAGMAVVFLEPCAPGALACAIHEVLAARERR
jgi:CheY-like chemotaxis protein